MIWIGRLISFAVILQTLEMFWIPAYRAELLRPEFPFALRWILRFTRGLLILRMLAACVALVFPSAEVVSILFLTTWAIDIRWRGTFNGGSDVMTFHILAAWLLSLYFPEYARVCVFYIAVQFVLSFFVAGLAKVFNSQWRTGGALRVFMGRWGYDVGSKSGRALSWSVMAFELLFPLVIFMPWPFLAGAMVFQLANAYVFGLNRFFFAWLAAYPAVLSVAAVSTGRA